VVILVIDLKTNNLYYSNKINIKQFWLWFRSDNDRVLKKKDNWSTTATRSYCMKFKFFHKSLNLAEYINNITNYKIVKKFLLLLVLTNFRQRKYKNLKIINHKSLKIQHKSTNLHYPILHLKQAMRFFIFIFI
jgi:hypothetical protein